MGDAVHLINLTNMSPSPSPPKYVSDLESLYGPPSQAGFGSVVFYEQLSPTVDLEPSALKYYRHFVGDLWEHFGETAWMTLWKPFTGRELQNQEIAGALVKPPG
jgi:hypothetical protein